MLGLPSSSFTNSSPPPAPAPGALTALTPPHWTHPAIAMNALASNRRLRAVTAALAPEEASAAAAIIAAVGGAAVGFYVARRSGTGSGPAGGGSGDSAEGADEAGAARLLEVNESGWVTPASLSTLPAAPDFSRSFVTFKIDLAAKPSATMSDIPPYNLNNGHIPIDCILTVTERSSGESEVICLGGDCKTETVGVQQGVWMAPNADFVPIYSQSKCLTLKTYDRIGRAVQYSSVSGGRAGSVQSDRAVVDVAEAFSGLDLGVHRTTTPFLETTKEVVANGLSNEALSARTEFSNDRYDCVMECKRQDIAEPRL
eukprot:COSAG04_NODE_16_length_40397_cov_59.653677_3_plen_314_part_00